MRPTLLAALLGSILAVPAISAPPARRRETTPSQVRPDSGKPCRKTIGGPAPSLRQ